MTALPFVLTPDDQIRCTDEDCATCHPLPVPAVPLDVALAGHQVGAR